VGSELAESSPPPESLSVPDTGEIEEAIESDISASDTESESTEQE
jgi:hypothetical protein